MVWQAAEIRLEGPHSPQTTAGVLSWQPQGFSTSLMFLGPHLSSGQSGKAAFTALASSQVRAELTGGVLSPCMLPLASDLKEVEDKASGQWCSPLGFE